MRTIPRPGSARFGPRNSSPCPTQPAICRWRQAAALLRSHRDGSEVQPLLGASYRTAEALDASLLMESVLGLARRARVADRRGWRFCRTSRSRAGRTTRRRSSNSSRPAASNARSLRRLCSLRKDRQRPCVQHPEEAGGLHPRGGCRGRIPIGVGRVAPTASFAVPSRPCPPIAARKNATRSISRT